MKKGSTATKPYKARTPSLRAKKTFDIMSENGGIISTAMVAAGYSPITAATPSKLTNTKAWKDLMEEHFSDAKLAQKHDELLNSTRLDHMTFPMGPKTEKEQKILDAMDTEAPIKTMLEAEQALQRTDLTDDDIVAMLKDVNCTVRRIVHGQTARHVYFWSADNKARKEALDMAYKLKGSYAPEKNVNLNANLNLDTRDKNTAQLAHEYEEKLKQTMLQNVPTGTDINSRVATTTPDQE